MGGASPPVTSRWMGPPGFEKMGCPGSILPVLETMQRNGFFGPVMVIRSFSKVPRPTMMASAFSLRWTNRRLSSGEVQPAGMKDGEEILPSAEIARLVEIRGRCTGRG